MPTSYRAVESLNCHIRALCVEDLPEVLEIERTGYSFPWTEAVFRDCFRSNYRLWGIQIADRIVGYAVVAYMADEAHVLNICVSTGRRRSGLARHLLRHLVFAAARDGMTRILLEVRVSNYSATALYLAEGFVEVGQRLGYYPSSSGREDALVLSLAVASSGV